MSEKNAAALPSSPDEPDPAPTAELASVEHRLAQAQRRLAELRRLESVALLAGGIVHHLNNLFCVSMGYLKLLADEVGANPTARGYLGEVQQATDRAAELVRQLLGYAKDSESPAAVDVAAAVRALDLLVRQLVTEQVDVRTEIGRVSPVRAPRSQLDQLIISLVFGAREAMPDGGELTLSVGQLPAVPAEHRRDTTRPGPHVALTVAHRARPPHAEPHVQLIEPLPGWGVRFGPAAAQAIAESAGGHLVSHDDRGRTVRTAYLPVIPASAELDLEAPAPAADGRRETILIVEDEEKLRSLIVRSLRRHGFHLLVAANGEEALKVAHAHPGTIDLLLTDLVMPGLAGTEVAAALTARLPGLRVLYMSGHVEAAMGPAAGLSGREDILEKPFRPGALAQRVRDALDR